MLLVAKQIDKLNLHDLINSFDIILTESILSNWISQVGIIIFFDIKIVYNLNMAALIYMYNKYKLLPVNLVDLYGHTYMYILYGHCLLAENNVHTTNQQNCNINIF